MPIINAYRCLLRSRGNAETGDNTKFTINQKDIVSEYVPAIPQVLPKIKPKISVPKKKRMVNGTIEINVNVSIVLDKIGVMGLCLCIASEERL